MIWHNAITKSSVQPHGAFTMPIKNAMHCMAFFKYLI